nr:hypothetical protein [uncultured Catenibacterium sp.]
MADDLEKVGFNIVNGATNHAYDQGGHLAYYILSRYLINILR